MDPDLEAWARQLASSVNGTDDARLVELLAREIMLRWRNKAGTETAAQPTGPTMLDRFTTIYALHKSDAQKAILAIVEMIRAIGNGASLEAIRAGAMKGN
jgi:hypothetical protein